jgi:LysM repeat protein
MKMMRLKNLRLPLLLIVALLLNIFSYAQDGYREQIIQYIETYAPLAIKEMNRTGFPASIKIAQGIHESGAGRSNLVSRSNNHFGIKCKSSWEGEKVYHDDDEEGECFRKYESAEASYIDHSDYLKSQSRYSFLFEYEADDHVSWAWGLKKAGYATSPVYAETIIKYVETYQLNELNQFDDAEEDEIDLTEYLSMVRSNLPIINSSTTNNTSKPISSKEPIKESNKAFEEVEEKIRANNTKKSNGLYPSGVFKINGAKVVFAEEGTSLLSLAKKYKVQTSSLLLFNELPKKTTILKRDQLVYLQRKKKTGKKTYHRVRKGESLIEISQKEGVQLASLLKFNKLKAGQQPRSGQKLLLKEPVNNEKISAKSSNKKSSSKSKSIVHTVRNGESLWTIARKYNVTVSSIKSANKLKSEDLDIGQSLKIVK